MKTALSREKLAERLAEKGKVQAAQIKSFVETARKEKKSVFQVLVEKEVMKEDEVIDFLSDQLQIPMLNLGALRIPKEVIALVPKKLAEKYQIFPLSQINHLITVATSDPFEILLRDDLKGLTKCEVSWVLAPP